MIQKMIRVFVCPGVLIISLNLWAQNVVQNPTATQTINQPSGTTLDVNSEPMRVLRDIEPIEPAPQAPTSFPLGNDLSLNAHGTADLYLQNVPLYITSSTSVTPGAHDITVNSTAQLCPQGDSQGHFLCGIVVDPDTPLEEDLPASDWVIKGPTTLNVGFGKSHTAPFKIRQVGTMLFNSRNIILAGYSGDPSGMWINFLDRNFLPTITLPNDLTTSFAQITLGTNVNIQGTLTKQAGSFKIDHPLDPANKFLQHSFVESPDMMNVYNGVVILDTNGQATVVLPDYFESLNKDFRYQLTCIGKFAPVFIAEEVNNSEFRISGGTPGLKVSWQVTGIRKDAYAEAHRIQPVILKTESEHQNYQNRH